MSLCTSAVRVAETDCVTILVLYRSPCWMNSHEYVCTFGLPLRIVLCIYILLASPRYGSLDSLKLTVNRTSTIEYNHDDVQ